VAVDAEVSKMQHQWLNPTAKQVTCGFIMCDAKGQGAKEKTASCHLDFIGGNIRNCSWLLNSDKRLAEIKEVNKLTAAAAPISEASEMTMQRNVTTKTRRREIASKLKRRKRTR